jgi:outer membrane murein-binding lipoprotein Lpp
MIIYPDEKEIEDKIIASATARVIAAVLAPIEAPSNKIVDENLQNFPVLDKVKSECKKDHPDLSYFSAILASVGVNRNDDVFLAEEVWKARNTVINIPYNDLHEEKDIVGHVYNSRIVDSNLQVIAEEDSIPSDFSIECDLVLYKTIFPEKNKEILDGALNNTLYVSMEALMTDFAYALCKPDEKMQIITRNKSTSFLTKYLRAYDGTGEYAGYKVCRVLKNFRFSGIGNVSDPANLKSVYTKVDDVDLENKSAKAEIIKIKELNTDDETLILSLSQTLIEKEKKMDELEKAQASITKLTEELTETKEVIKTTTSELDKAKAEIETEKGKLEIATSQIDKLNTDKETLAAEVTRLQAELDIISAQIKEAKDKEVLANRLKSLADLNVKVSDDRVKTIASMNDEQFNDFVEWTKEITARKVDQKEDQTLDNTIDATENKDEDLNALANLKTEEGTNLKETAEKIINSLRKKKNNIKK